MTRPLPWPDVTQGEQLVTAAVQANFEDISKGWPLPTTAADVGIGEWTAYTPAVANTSVTLGTGGAITGRSMKIGKTAHVQGAILFGVGGVFTGGPITISLPYAAAAYIQTGVAHGYDASATQHATGIFQVLASASVGTPVLNDATSSGGVGGANPWTWALSDELRWSITYETAV